MAYVFAPDGTPGEVPDDQLQTALAQKFRLREPSADEVRRKTASDQPGQAALEGVARGATMGFGEEMLSRIEAEAQGKPRSHVRAEMKARKEALDDAISSTKAAVAEGIVPGGGLALLRATAAVAAAEALGTGDERTGAQILRRALEAPARQIAENSAADGGVVVDRMLNSSGNTGFDAARKQYVDLLEAGIVDPAKVVRTALQNAVSVASVLLLTEATLTELPDRPKEHAQEEPAPM